MTKGQGVRSRRGLAAALVVLALGAGARADELPGFPASLPVARGALLLADLDGDGTPDLVAVGGDTLTALGRDGKPMAGFPVAFGRGTTPPLVLAAGATACDIQGDGKPELVVGGSDRRLYAVDAHGEVVAGFPVELPGEPRALAACVGVKGGGKESLALSVSSGQLLLLAPGAKEARVISKVGEGAESGVAATDLDGDGVVDLLTVGGDGALHAVAADGRRLWTKPYRMAFRASGAPALGDVDDDGKIEIVVGSQDFKVHAVSVAGAGLAGFPVDTGYRVYAGVALGDVDGDGVTDAVAASGDGALYVVNGRGAALPGFPMRLDGRVVAEPVVGDLDRDGRQELVVLTQAGTLYVVSAGGKSVPGTPLHFVGKGESAPAIVDLDGDGRLEVIVAPGDGKVHALRLGERGKAERALAAWPQAAHDGRRTGRFNTSEGRFKGLGFAAASPSTDDALEPRFTFIDPDGRTDAGAQIRWLRDGRRVPELDNARRVPPELTRKHQRWRYTLQDARNHEAYGEAGVLVRRYDSPDVEIRNTPPAAPAIELGPAAARVTTRLEVKVTRASADVDADTVGYRYLWLRDGVPQPLPPTTNVLAPGLAKKHEVWRVLVVPNDGEVDGPPSSAEITVINTPPGAPVVVFDPPSPRIDDVVRVVVSKPAPDDDGDPIHYIHAYTLGATDLNLPPPAAMIPARTLRKHERMRVDVTAWDDEVGGGKAAATLQVRNTPPPAPRIALWPRRPRTRDDLRLSIEATEADADRDPVTLRRGWTRNGVKVDFADVVPASATRKHERWRVEITPHDGEESGATVAAEVVVENSPPRPPLLTLDRSEIYTDEDVVPRVVLPASDDDGDPIAIKYVWRLEDKVVPFPPGKVSLTAADTERDQHWELVVTPNDGETDGEAAHLVFQIDNSPPTAPEIALSATEPTVRDRVQVRVTRSSTDKDGDPIVYHYFWYRDGQLQFTWPVEKDALEPMQARKGESWRVEVRGYDGTDEGAPAFAELRVVNHRPDAPRVVVRPDAPSAVDTLECALASPGVDPDGDPLSYETTWLVGGARVPLPPDSVRSLPAIARKGQVWSCEMVASDGVLRSEVGRSPPVTLLDSPPSAPGVVIEPATPGTDDDLVCAVARPAIDLDLDAVSYRYAWQLDGKPWVDPPASTRPAERIPAALTRREQLWDCTVTPSDGAVDGPAESARARVANTPPTAPRAALVPEQPQAGNAIACEVTTPSRDVDGDEVHYLYTWLRDGVAQPFAPTSTSVPARLVKAGDRWRCLVVGADDVAVGPAARTPEVVVATAPPGAPPSSRLPDVASGR